MITMLNAESKEWRKFRHFNAEEFRCRCVNRAGGDGRPYPQCLGVNISLQLVSMLDEARENAGVPFVITSGYRCRVWNSDVGGVHRSAHTLGLAADIACGLDEDHKRFLIFTGMFIVEFPRIEIGQSYLHTDIDYERPLKWLSLKPVRKLEIAAVYKPGGYSTGKVRDVWPTDRRLYAGEKLPWEAA